MYGKKSYRDCSVVVVVVVVVVVAGGIVVQFFGNSHAFGQFLGAGHKLRGSNQVSLFRRTKNLARRWVYHVDDTRMI